MGKKEFDYYIFIDYSEELVGYIIVDKINIKNCLEKSSKLKHYSELRQKDLYLKSMKKLFDKNQLLNCLNKYRIAELRYSMEVCSEVLEFCNKKCESRIFISIDDRQYKGFMKILRALDGKRFTVSKEGKLKRNSKEHQLSLIIDTLLNLKRTKNEK